MLAYRTKRVAVKQSYVLLLELLRSTQHLSGSVAQTPGCLSICYANALSLKCRQLLHVESANSEPCQG